MPDFLNALRTFRTIRGKLGAAIALIIGLALCIGLVAVMSFTHFGKIFDAIISGALPEIQVANEIAVMAKDVAAAAPALGLSPDLPHLDLKRRRILDQMEKIKASAASFKGDFLENAGPKIQLSIHALEGHLEALFLNRKRELILHLEIDGLLLEVETVSGELNEILQPVRDKTLIKLILTLIELSGAEGEGADEMMNQTINEDLPNFQASLEIGMCVERAASLLYRAAAARDETVLSRLKTRFDEALNKLRLDLANLSSRSAAESLLKRIDRLERIAFSPQGLFPLKRETLEMAAQNVTRLARSRQGAAELTHLASKFAADAIGKTESEAGKMRSAQRRGALAILAFSLASALLAYFVAWRRVVVRLISRLHRLRESMVSGRKGAPDPAIDTEGEDEVAEMAGALTYFIETIRKDNERRKRVLEEMKKARDMTEAASRAKSEFLANMSHELRTPLNAILGFSQIQLTHPDFPASMREGASIIKNSGEHLLTLITDILDISRIEAGKLELVRREIRLPWFIDNIEAIIAVRAREKGISFSVEKKGDPPEYIEADETRLRQVLLNLLGNAVKFTEKGYVRLRVESGMREGGKSALIRFEIKDSGVGIAEDQMDTVFQPFEQAAEVRFKSAGAGLGLPISRKLVRLMGGEPRVESVPGKGSTFQFQLRLPVLHGPAAPPREPNEAIIGYSGPARGILVVDDKMENRLALAGMLSPLGFDVIQAGGGREGVELAASASIDLVIMDLIMPDLDGMAATRRIRALDGRGNLPVIAYSASAFAEDRERCLAAGCNEFLPKPASREELLGILRKYLALEWQNASPPEPPESPAEMGEPPPAADLEELHELARYGNMRKIRQWSETLPTRSPGARAFAEHIRTLAENYEERKIITLLEKLKEKES